MYRSKQFYALSKRNSSFPFRIFFLSTHKLLFPKHKSLKEWEAASTQSVFLWSLQIHKSKPCYKFNFLGHFQVHIKDLLKGKDLSLNSLGGQEIKSFFSKGEKVLCCS